MLNSKKLVIYRLSHRIISTIKILVNVTVIDSGENLNYNIIVKLGYTYRKPHYQARREYFESA